jgi:hypothetical protein
MVALGLPLISTLFIPPSGRALVRAKLTELGIDYQLVNVQENLRG